MKYSDYRRFIIVLTVIEVEDYTVTYTIYNLEEYMIMVMDTNTTTTIITEPSPLLVDQRCYSDDSCRF